MAKLTKQDYISIVERTIAGETRKAIAADLPVDVRRVSKIICELADGEAPECVTSVLEGYLTKDKLEQLLQIRLRPGRNRKRDFMEKARRTSKTEREYELRIQGWQEGYRTGYNQARRLKG